MMSRGRGGSRGAIARDGTAAIHRLMLITGIVVSGFVAAVLAPYLYRVAGRATAWVFAAFALALAGLLAGYAPAVAAGFQPSVAYEWAADIGLSLAFRLDGLALIFASLIAGFGAIVFAYSGEYLHGRPDTGRFFALMAMFMASMLGIALSDNLLLLYLFWELTTVSSYLLIGFDHERVEARRAAVQALVVTFAGGLALLAGIILLGSAAGTFSISELAGRGTAVTGHPVYPAVLILFLAGAFTKSAQFPFHFWLPDAMEAPTPVSAYLHSVAMVKAGIYLLARMAPVLGGTDEWYYALVTAGAVTLVTGALIGLRKDDLKQILAYATVAVLGLLTLLIGIGTRESYQAAIVYFAAHAMYKGALFLTVGAVDHEAGTRDLSRLGGLWRRMPLTAAAALAAAASMAGLPPTLGYIGKEEAYAAALGAPRLAQALLATTAASGALLFVLAGLVGIGPYFGRRRDPDVEAHEAPFAMWIGPVLLAAGGFALALAPGAIEPVLAPAIASVAGQPVQEIHLELFHGFTPVFLLGLGATAAGAALLFFAPKLRTAEFRLSGAGRFGPAAWSRAVAAGTMRFARFQTGVLQSGQLRRYLIIVVATTVSLIALAYSRYPQWWIMPGLMPMRPYEGVLAVVMVFAAVAAVRTSEPLTAVVSLGIVGFGIALVFALYGAPDLALTQLIAEAMTLVLLVIVFYLLPDFTTRTDKRGRFRDAAIAATAGAWMAVLSLASFSVEFTNGVSEYYIVNSREVAKGRNVVNLILTDFRALDTLGEITVLGVAAAGVYSLLRLRYRRRGQP